MKKFPFSKDVVSEVEAIIRANLATTDAEKCVLEYGDWHSTDGESFQAVIDIENKPYTFEITLSVTCSYLGETFSW